MGRNDRMTKCLFVRVRHAKFCIMQLFLFCPVQLSACKYIDIPLFKAVMVKEVVSVTNHRICTFTTVSLPVKKLI